MLLNYLKRGRGRSALQRPPPLRRKKLLQFSTLKKSGRKLTSLFSVISYLLHFCISFYIDNLKIILSRVLIIFFILAYFKFIFIILKTRSGHFCLKIIPLPRFRSAEAHEYIILNFYYRNVFSYNFMKCTIFL